MREKSSLFGEDWCGFADMPPTVSSGIGYGLRKFYAGVVGAPLTERMQDLLQCIDAESADPVRDGCPAIQPQRRPAN